MGKVIMLPQVRCSFLVLGEPEDYQGNKKFRWSATALIPANSLLKGQVDAALREVAKEKWEKKWQSYFENIITDAKACCLVDGKRKPDYEGYVGHFALTAHRQLEKGRPLVMDKDKSPIYKADNTLYEGKAVVLYSGCFVNMQVELWAQDNDNGKALRASLLGIQKYKDGDSFGGGSAPDADAFGEITEGADAEDLS
jgi:hypothetical protein